MGLFDWLLESLSITGFLEYLGLTSKKAKLMLLGLDNAGVPSQAISNHITCYHVTSCHVRRCLISG